MSYKINKNSFSYKIRTEDNFLSQNDFNELINLNILKKTKVNLIYFTMKLMITELFDPLSIKNLLKSYTKIII